MPEGPASQRAQHVGDDWLGLSRVERAKPCEAGIRARSRRAGTRGAACLKTCRTAHSASGGMAVRQGFEP